MMSNSNLRNEYSGFFNDWFDLKKKAIKYNTTDHWELYVWFLKESKQEFSKVYVNMKNEKWVEVVGELIKQLTCELKESSIKYKKCLLNVKKGG